MIPLIVVILAIGGAVGALAYVNAKFASVNSVSAPPPEVSGADLGGGEDLLIDTGPAREAIRQAQGDTGLSEELPTQTGSDGDGSTPTTAATPGSTASPVVAGSSNQSVTILLMGVDARPGQAIDIGVRPDSLAVINLNPDRGACRILSIPRDSRVELPGYGQSKINHALAVGGIPYEILVVENLLGIPLDHYGLIDFSGVERLVDAVGGVTVDNDGEFTVGELVFEEGDVTLTGEEALAYSRFRFDEHGDFGRQERQQQIIRALLGEISGPNMIGVLPGLLETVEGHVRTDLRPSSLIDLARVHQPSCGAGTLETDRVDGAVATRFDDMLKMDLSFVLVDDSELSQKVTWLMGQG